MFSFLAGAEIFSGDRGPEGREGDSVVRGAQGPRQVSKECHVVSEGHGHGQVLRGALNRSVGFCSVLGGWRNYLRSS